MVFLALLTLYLVCGALVAAVIVQDRAKGRGSAAHRAATARASTTRAPATRAAAVDPRTTHGSDLVFRTQA